MNCFYLLLIILTPSLSTIPPKNTDGKFHLLKGRILAGDEQKKTELTASSKSFDPKKMYDVWKNKNLKEQNLNQIKGLLSEMEVGLGLLKDEAKSKVSSMNELLDSNLNSGNVFQVKLNALF